MAKEMEDRLIRRSATFATVSWAWPGSCTPWRRVDATVSQLADELPRYEICKTKQQVGAGGDPGRARRAGKTLLGCPERSHGWTASGLARQVVADSRQQHGADCARSWPRRHSAAESQSLCDEAASKRLRRMHDAACIVHAVESTCILPMTLSQLRSRLATIRSVPTQGWRTCGNQDRAIGLLVVFQDGHQGPADGDRGAVERMDQLRSFLARVFVANIQPAGLVVGAVGGAGDLAPLASLAAAGHPGLQVELAIGGPPRSPVAVSTTR